LNTERLGALSLLLKELVNAEVLLGKCLLRERLPCRRCA